MCAHQKVHKTLHANPVEIKMTSGCEKDATRVWGENCFFFLVGEIFGGFASEWTLIVSGVREDNLLIVPTAVLSFSWSAD